MTAGQFAQLVFLSSMWGSSFMLMRFAVPQLGPVWLLEGRLLAATLVLLVVSLMLRKPIHARRHWRHYAILGIFNSAVPFYAFAYAAQTLPASLLSILNSTAPLWGLIVGFLWRGKPVTGRAVFGLILGMAGVATLVSLGGLSLQPGALLAVVMALAATICYAIASSYAEYAETVETYANAHGSLWAAFFIMLPLLAVSPPPVAWTAAAVAATLVLGILCSGIAYLLYFHLIATAGAPAAMTVGYLIPLWGVMWGWLLLDEVIGWHTFLGAALVISGTVLVSGFRPQNVFSKTRTRSSGATST